MRILKIKNSTGGVGDRARSAALDEEKAVLAATVEAREQEIGELLGTSESQEQVPTRH